MSAAAQTKIFGIRLALNPKLLVLGLVVVAGVLFWYNSRDGEEGAAHPAATQTAQPTTASIAVKTHTARVRRSSQTSEHATLRVRSIDAASGDVDPTLRLGLLSRLQSVALPSGERNVFESGPDPVIAQQQAALAAKAPKIMPASVAPAAAPVNSGPPPLNIPLKYYGFAKSGSNADPNSGFFLDGDNVLVASEGELLQKRYLVVELTVNTAKLEDTQVKRGQTLQVVPEATVQ